MNAKQYQLEHGLTDAQMCRLLNDSKEPTEDPIFEDRLARLKSGYGKVFGHEVKALMTATNEESDRYC